MRNAHVWSLFVAQKRVIRNKTTGGVQLEMLQA